MKTIITMLLGIVLAGCQTQGAGERCDPLRATNDCDDGLSCVYPTGPQCGVSYCCAVDPHGAIVDGDPNCRPDPVSAMQCGIDLGVAVDLSSHD